VADRTAIFDDIGKSPRYALRRAGDGSTECPDSTPKSVRFLLGNWRPDSGVSPPESKVEGRLG
jgi:hypothetical protein